MGDPFSHEHDKSGARLGPFLLRHVCGQGAMGVVYAASDLRDGRPVAVKVLTAAVVTDPPRLRRFAAEAEVLSSLDHPGIVRYVDHGTTPGGEPFLAMEWLEGEDLSQRLQRGGLSLRESVTLGRRVAEALAAAHARGIIHRDIKPGNLFLRGGDVDGVAILDFGIARIAAVSSGLTITGAAIGTPGYMAPEQARGARDIDARADIFALGAVLFECLAGRPAFAGRHLLAVLAKLLLEDPPRLLELRGDVPAGLDELLGRMLEKDAAARPESAAEVAAELAAMSLADEGPSAGATPRATLEAGLTSSERRFLSMVIAATPDMKTDSETHLRALQ